MWRLMSVTAVSFTLGAVMLAGVVPGLPRPGGAAAAQAHGVERAADLRVQLSRLLGEHVFLTVQAMRAGVGGADDLAAAAEALEGNTTDLAGLIGSVYGDSAAADFADLWRTHIGYLVDYTRAVAAADASGKDTALAGLQTFEGELIEFLSDAAPSLDRADLEVLVGEHVLLLTQLGDAIESDHEGAYDAAREAYHHMFMLGEQLAQAIASEFPDRFGGADVAASPALDLRITLDRLLGEHTFLSVEAMRGTAAAQAHADPARRALDENSAELVAAIDSVYGSEAAQGFGETWADHTDAYLAYIDAVRASDDDAARMARERLDRFAETFGEVLSTVNPSLDADDVASLLGSHAEHLVSQVDAYREGDYSTAYSIARDAYRHTQVISDVLATAIAQQFPEIFPPLPPTAGTAQAPAPGNPDHWRLVAALLVMTALLVIIALVGLDRRSRRSRAA